MSISWGSTTTLFIGGIVVLAGFGIMDSAERTNGNRLAEAKQQRYVVSRPERCDEIINGGVGHLTNSGPPIEYLLCKTPDGDSMFYRKLGDKDRSVTSWTEHQYK